MAIQCIVAEVERSSTGKPRPWPTERVEQWRSMRARGMQSFIWGYGVLRWGGLMCCFSMAVFNYSHYGQVFSFEGNWIMRVLLGLLTWTFVGYGYGHSQWRRNEQIYQRQAGNSPLRGDLEA